MRPRLALLVSHPIPYFVAAYRELHASGRVDLRVFFCCDWGLQTYRDPQFGVDVRWDVPLLEGYPHQFLPIAARPEKLGFWEVDNPAVADALDRFDAQVVLVHGYARRTVWRAVNWARRRRRTVLLYSDSNIADRPSPLRRAIKQLVVGRFYSKVDGAMWVSDANRDYHRMYGMPEDRLYPGVIPVEAERLLASVPDRQAARRAIRARFRIPENAFVLVLSGKYAPHKRPLDLLRAIDVLGTRRRPVWALLVGDGPERAALQAHLTRARTPAVLTGFINQSDIGAYYAAADVAVSTSSREPLGLAIVEGVAFGLPVIASDCVGVVGPSGAVRPDVNALIYPAGDAAALATAIERLLDDDALRGRMASASLSLAPLQTPRAAALGIAAAASQLAAAGPRRARPAGMALTAC